MTEDERELVRYGSIHAATPHIGEKRATQALASLTLQAPFALQSDSSLVMSWGRWQSVFELAYDMDDSRMMADAIRGQEAIMKSVH